MSTLAWFGLLLLANVGMFWLPLLPALREWRRHDSDPLRIPADDEAGTDYFAERFRLRLAADWDDATLFARQSAEDAGAWPRFQDAVARLPSPISSRYRLATGDGVVRGERSLRERELPVLVGDQVELAAGGNYLGEIFARERIVIAAGSVIRAALCDGRIELGAGCGVLRWVHARQVVIGAGARVAGRVSASTEIRIAPDCRFERLSAPIIAFGNGATPAALPAQGLPEADPARLSDAEWQPAARRWLCTGDLSIPDGHAVDGHLVVRGHLRIGSHCRIEGSIKAHGGASIGPGTRVAGAVFAHGPIEIADGCTLAGPLSSSRGILLGDGCTVGAIDALASLAAPSITVSGHCTCHGSLWARSHGTTCG